MFPLGHGTGDKRCPSAALQTWLRWRCVTVLMIDQQKKGLGLLKYSGVYLVIFVTMLVVDMIWLRLIAVSVYEQGMGDLLAESPNLVAAAAFYLLFPVGLLVFGVVPAETSSIWKAAGMGALFGFFAYATYDLTNLAVVKNWPLGLSLLDMAWGTLVSGMSTAAGKAGLDFLNR